MSQNLDAYELIGIVAPGSIAILGVSLSFPDIKAYVVNDSVSVGGLGIFVILSFTAGHLVQAIGNLLETLFWKLLGGLPSQWVISPQQTLLSEGQRERLMVKVRSIDPNFTQEMSNAGPAWFAITREIYAKVRAAKSADRIDAFNRNYGLLRGVAAASIVATIMVAFVRGVDWSLVVLSIAATAVAVYRMYVFGKHYARELFVAFLSVP